LTSRPTIATSTAMLWLIWQAHLLLCIH